MKTLGAFDILPEPCLSKILHFTDVRELLRCQRLSSFFNAFIHHNLKTIRPQKIIDTTVTFTIGKIGDETFYLSPSKAKRKHHLHLLIGEPVGKRTRKLTKSSLIEGCTIVSKGNQHTLNPTWIWEKRRGFVRSVAERLHWAFKFESLQYSAYFCHNIALIAIFDDLRQINFSRARPLTMDVVDKAMFQLPKLEKIYTYDATFYVTDEFLSSDLAKRLTVLKIECNDEFRKPIGDEVLLQLTNLEELHVHDSYTPAHTSITLDGLHQLQEQWIAGKRLNLRFMEFSMTGRFVEDRSLIVHEQHRCRKCHLLAKMTEFRTRDDVAGQQYFLPSNVHNCFYFSSMSVVGDFAVLPELCLSRILHFVDYRDLYRCERLSSFFNDFIRKNLKTIRPQRIADTELTLCIVNGIFGEIVLSPPDATAIKHRLDYVVDDNITPNSTAVDFKPFEDCLVISDGRQRYIITNLKDDSPEVFDKRFLQRIIEIFAFDSIKFPDESSLPLELLSVFTEIHHLLFDDDADDPEHLQEVLQQFPKLETIYSSRSNDILTSEFLASDVAKKLTKIDISSKHEVDTGFASAFDDTVLKALTNLEVLRVLYGTDRRRRAITGITLNGLWKLQRQWLRGQRLRLRLFEFAVAGCFWAQGSAAVHEFHPCKKCHLVVDACESVGLTPDDVEAHVLFSGFSMPLLFQVVYVNDTRYAIVMEIFKEEHSLWSAEEIQELKEHASWAEAPGGDPRKRWPKLRIHQKKANS